MKKIISLVSAGILCFSCEKVAKIKLPEVENEPVIATFLCPEDNSIIIHLSWTDPLYSDNELDRQSIEDATVVISDGATEITIPYDFADEWYELDTAQFQIIAGGTYTVNIVTANGKQASATTSVPINNVNSLVTYQENFVYLDSNASYIQTESEIDMEWQDFAGEENYYSVSYYTLQYYPITGDTIDQFSYTMLFTDAGRDGQLIDGSALIYSSYSPGGYVPLGTRIVLATVNKDYYEYHRTVLLGTYSDPFTEPALIYSNVSGGFGVVSGYRQNIFDFYH